MANGVLFIVVILYGSATFEAEVKIAPFDVVNDIIAAASPSTLNLAIFAKNRGGVLFLQITIVFLLTAGCCYDIIADVKGTNSILPIG